MAKEREACGRCSTSVAVEAAADGESRDPYGEERIEVEADELRTLSPDGWISRLSGRIDGAVERFTWGR